MNRPKKINKTNQVQKQIQTQQMVVEPPASALHLRASKILLAAMATAGLAFPGIVCIEASAQTSLPGTTSSSTGTSPTTLETPAGATVAAPSPAANALISNAIGPNTIADVAQAVAPSVVKIETDQGARTAQIPSIFRDFFGQGRGTPFELFFNGQRVTPDSLNGRGNQRPHSVVPNNGQARPKVQVQPNAQSNQNSPGNKDGYQMAPIRPFHPQNEGTGFIVRPNGMILTNAHVVKGAAKIMVTLNDGRQLPAKVIGTDGFTDIAVIKIDADNLPVARIGTTKGLRPGEFCIAIGSPMGFDHSVTFGIISAVGRSLPNVNESVHLIQTDASINPGNSGGPLLNLAGEVIGINEAIYSSAQNIGFSIPIDEVKDVFESLIAHKRIERPYLGISMRQIDEQISKAQGLPEGTKGVFINQVFVGPASMAGLRPGDIISKIDGKEVNSAKEVQDIVRSHRVSDKINLLILHDNQMKAIACNIAQRPDASSTEEAEQQPEEQQDE